MVERIIEKNMINSTFPFCSTRELWIFVVGLRFLFKKLALKNLVRQLRNKSRLSKKKAQLTFDRCQVYNNDDSNNSSWVIHPLQHNTRLLVSIFQL